MHGADPTSNGAFNAGIIGLMMGGTGIIAEANGTPSFDVGSGKPIALYALAKKNSEKPYALSVEDGLKEKLGPVGYAKALAELKKRIDAK